MLSTGESLKNKEKMEDFQMKKATAILTAGIMAMGVITSGVTVFAEETEEKTYSVTYNMNNGNAEDMPEHPGYYTLVIVKDRKDEEE